MCECVCSHSWLDVGKRRSNRMKCLMVQPHADLISFQREQQTRWDIVFPYDDNWLWKSLESVMKLNGNSATHYMENIALEKCCKLVSNLSTVISFPQLLSPASYSPLFVFLSSLLLHSSVEISHRQGPRPRPTVLCGRQSAPETDPWRRPRGPRSQQWPPEWWLHQVQSSWLYI